MPKLETFSVTPELQQVLDNLPADQPRSKLEPFRPFILRWRREGRSYDRIRRILREDCDVKVSVSTLFKFVQRRSRPRKAQPAPEIEHETSVAGPEQAIRQAKRLTAEERAAQVEFVRSLNQPTSEEQPKSGWDFDVDKPRTIQKL
jgi:hypothetical protein